MIAISGRIEILFSDQRSTIWFFNGFFLPRVHFQDVLCKQVETGGLKMRPSAIQPRPKFTWQTKLSVEEFSEPLRSYFSLSYKLRRKRFSIFSQVSTS